MTALDDHTAEVATVEPVPTAGRAFTLFETLQVRPLAMSPDGRTLFALNTPDNRLEIYRVAGDRLVHAGSVTVGLEPTAIAVRSNTEVWVTNHLSDSVSIVRLGAGNCRCAGTERPESQWRKRHHPGRTRPAMRHADQGGIARSA